MKLLHASLALTVVLAGCATSPKDVQPLYVSPVLYQNMSCDQLRGEAVRVSNAAAVAAGKQQAQQTTDAVAVTAAIIVFWPAAFFVGGDKNAAQLAQLKGEMQAIEQVNAAKNCGISFQQG